MGLSLNRFCLILNRFCFNGLAGGHRAGQCTRRSLHKFTLSLGVWLGVGVARVFRTQSTSQVSELRLPSSEKSCRNFETHEESKTRFQRQGPADLQPFRHDEECLLCRIRCRMRYNPRHRMRCRIQYRKESFSFTLIVSCNDIPAGARPTTGTVSPLIVLSRATLSRTLQSGTVDRKRARGSCKPG